MVKIRCRNKLCLIIFYHDFFIFCFLFIPLISIAQKDDSLSIFRYPIGLDSATIKSDFDIKSFIRRIQSDTTFYKAFKSMDLVPNNAVNDIKVYNKNGKVIASMNCKTRQAINDGCRTTQTSNEKVTGNFYKKNGDYNYYTAALYDYLFFAKEPVCNEDDIVNGREETYGKGLMERSEYELKQLIFNPGSKINGIPLMGKKAEIFEKDRDKHYDLKISRDTCNGERCYVLRITPKQGYQNKAVYKELTTWFRTSDYAIVARNYSLSLNTRIYDFDVHMKVRMKQIGKKLYPTWIDYDGNWHAASKKREIVKFEMRIEY